MTLARAISIKVLERKLGPLMGWLAEQTEVKCWIHKVQISCEQLFRGEGSRGWWAEMLYKYVRVNSTYHCADFSKRRAQLE